MYLVDSQIRGRLSALQIETRHPSHDFNADEQIQPCSIDLRLDNVFWRAGRKVKVDLRRSTVESFRPRRGWRSMRLDDGESITLRPREMLFGRVYERFRMPNDLAGKIEGRSSFSRFGLSIHCTSDFINPGWYGYMPLQLLNSGPHPIRILPYLPICQLKLVQLSAEPARPYGHEDLNSKYLNDDGGPSFWWRDARIKKLHEWLQLHNLPLKIEERLRELTDGREVEIIERFQAFLDRLPASKAENGDEVFESFARKEQVRRAARLSGRVISGTMFTTLFAFAVGEFLQGGPVCSPTTAMAVVFGLLSLVDLVYPRTGYLLPKDLEPRQQM